MGPVFLRWVACLTLCGCGRLGFDSVGSLGDDTGSGVAMLSYPVDTAYGIRTVAPLSLVPWFTGKPTFDAVTPLPLGVTLDAMTGVIGGTPQVDIDDTFVVRATSSLGIATAKVTLLYAGGYRVDVTVDGPDDNANDETCFSTQAGGCSLRAAVQTANAHPAVRHVIELGAATYQVNSAMNDIVSDIVIVGAGDQSTTVRSQPAQGGYGLFALAVARTLTLARSSFTDFGMRNGAVVNQTKGLLNVDGCTFKNNHSAGSGGVFFVAGGGVARITRSTFTKNESFGGCCSGWGGVIDGEEGSTSISVTQSLAIENQSAWGSFAHITDGTKLLLENSTLYGNIATIAGTLASPGGEYTLRNDTIVGNTNTNTTPESAGLFLFSDPAHYTVQSSIIAFNHDITGAENNCNRRLQTLTLTSNGGNVISDGAGNCGMYFTASADRLMTDPGLVTGPPTANGGVTDTIMPASSSTVLGAGSNCPAVDQRGWPRDLAVCDVGAVEMP
jgi:CSLREA domain-containing protein